MADDVIKEAMEAFDRAVEREDGMRATWRDNVDFALRENQWPAAMKRQRERDGRPCLTINKLATMGRQVVNDARQNKPSIKVHPVDSGGDPETAEIFGGLIRNIEQSSNADVAYDTALEHAVFGGFGYFRINTRYSSDDTFEQDLVIERIANPLAVYGDCYSTAADSSDWNTAFVTESMTKAAFAAKYKGAAPVDWTADSWRDVSAPWLDGDNVLTAEYWTREDSRRQILLLSDGSIVDAMAFEAQRELYGAVGVTVTSERDVATHKVVQRVLSGAEELSKVEWPGRFIPIIPVYGSEVNFEGERSFRSLIQGAKDAQRMFNYWRTTSTEAVALTPKTPFIGRKGAFETDSEKWATANTENHAYIEFDGAEAPVRQPFAGVPAGALQEALNASDDIKAVMGIYDAGLGARSNETSGRAISARQMESDTATFHFIDNLSRAISHAGRILVDLIPHVYSVPRIIRVLGPDGETTMTQVNEEHVVQEEDPDTGELRDITRIYDLTTGRYDVTVTAGPSFNSRREEAANQMVELIRAFPAAAPVLGDLLAKNLDWPGADEVAERLQKLIPGHAEAGGGEAQQEVVAAMQQMQAQLQALERENADLKAQYDLKSQEVQIKAFDAETARIEAMKPTPPPRAIMDAA